MGDVNKHYQECRFIISVLESRIKNSGLSIAVFGSANYGSKEIQSSLTKPTAESDIDCMVLVKNIESLHALDDLVRPHEEGMSLFENRYADLLVLRGEHNGRKLSFGCVTPEIYSALCNNEVPFITTYKKLKVTKPRVSPNYPFIVFGFNKQETQHSRITPLQEGHFVVYPNTSRLTDGNFCYTVFQDQIATQTEIIDSTGLLKQGREQVLQHAKEEAQRAGADPVALHRVRIPFWDEEFLESMRRRYK